MFLVNFARTYAYVEYQFEDPLDYDDQKLEIDFTKDYEEIQKDLEDNKKEDLKLHSKL